MIRSVTMVAVFLAVVGLAAHFATLGKEDVQKVLLVLTLLNVGTIVKVVEQDRRIKALEQKGGER